MGAKILAAALFAGLVSVACGSGIDDAAPGGGQALSASPLQTGGVVKLTNVGKSPEGIAVNLQTHRVFINSEPEDGPSGIFGFDPVHFVVAPPIEIPSEGEYMAVNPATNLLYHPNNKTSDVAVIDGATDRVIEEISLRFADGGWTPEGVAIDVAQNLIYVGAKSPEVEWEEGGVKPPGCQMIPDPLEEHGVECWHPGRVFVIDGETNQLARAADGTPLSFLAGDDPESVVFAAATGKVYAANEDDGTITVARGAKRTAGGITGPEVLSTISGGVALPGWVRPACDADLNCTPLVPLWPSASACAPWDKAQEADKMAVDPAGNVYITDDKYRVAKIDGATDAVVTVLPIEGYGCPDPGTGLLGANTSNNIAIGAGEKVRLYVTSEQNTVSVIDPASMTLLATITVPGAIHLDAITADAAMNRVYITDEVPALFVLQGSCAAGDPSACVFEPGCTPGDRAYCNWVGSCNANGITCDCDDSQHRLSSERCGVWHVTTAAPGPVCTPGDPAFCHYMGVCNASGTACECSAPTHWWYSENCSTYHATTPPASGVTLAASRTSPSIAGMPVVFTASGQGSGNYQYKFWLHDGTSWNMVRDYGTGATWTLPASTVPGRYRVAVYVRTNPASAVDALTTMAYELRLAPATGVALTPSAPSPHPSGTPVTFVAEGQGSSGYQYQFWFKTAAGWSIVQDYGDANTWTLPESTPPGSYNVAVYVRTNPTVALDAFRQFQYLIQ